MTWEVTGYDKRTELVAHSASLDDALARLLQIPVGERGPCYVSLEGVRALGRLLAMPLDPDRARFVMEQEPPRGWIVREIDDRGPVDEIDVDWELTRVFAELLGEDLGYMRGPAFGAGFPLDDTKFAKLTHMFDLDLGWDQANWFLELTANPR